MQAHACTRLRSRAHTHTRAHHIIDEEEDDVCERTGEAMGVDGDDKCETHGDDDDDDHDDDDDGEEDADHNEDDQQHLC